MKERRHAGATHSFRLTMRAASLVDSINYPRRLGGKSKKVSDAIEAYFGKRLDDGIEAPSYSELLLNIAGLQQKIMDLHQELNEVTSTREIANNEAKHTSPGWVWSIIYRIFGR